MEKIENMNNKDYLQWYQSLPIYNDEQPKKIEEFNSNEKFEDPNFPPNRESLVSQEIINNLNQDLQLYSQNQEKKEELEEKINLANQLHELRYKNKEIKWKRISEIIPNCELFPNEFHCDCFSQNILEIVILLI